MKPATQPSFPTSFLFIIVRFLRRFDLVTCLFCEAKGGVKHQLYKRISKQNQIDFQGGKKEGKNDSMGLIA